MCRELLRYLSLCVQGFIVLPTFSLFEQALLHELGAKREEARAKDNEELCKSIPELTLAVSC